MDIERLVDVCQPRVKREYTHLIKTFGRRKVEEAIIEYFIASTDQRDIYQITDNLKKS